MFLFYLSQFLDTGLGAEFFCFYFSHESARRVNYQLKLETCKGHFQIPLWYSLTLLGEGPIKESVSPVQNEDMGPLFKMKHFRTVVAEH